MCHQDKGCFLMLLFLLHVCVLCRRGLLLRLGVLEPCSLCSVSHSGDVARGQSELRRAAF